MNLSQALRLWDPASKNARLAITGAGGKTTALFQLAGQLAKGRRAPILVTTTTHLATSQLGLADRLLVIKEPEDIQNIESRLSPGVILVISAESNANRVSGLDPVSFERLHRLADAHDLALLIEADGSRQQPLKAPADHEPVIPPFVDTVLVVSGLLGLGKPLTSAWVHRPDRFAALSGLEPGEPITREALARVLLADNGGLKGIPPGARRVMLLNQADTPELYAHGRAMVQELLPAYDAVLVASLEPAGTVSAAYESVAGIVLAAGEGKRFGQPKQLLPWHGQPFVWHAVQAALRGGLSPVVVVTGAHAAGVEGALQDLPVILVQNPDWGQGQSTSLRAGLRRLPPSVKAAVFLLADQPQIPAELVRMLVDTHAATLSPLVAPRVNGRRANPVLFGILTFPDLLALSGDTGGRLLFTEPTHYPIAWVDWPDDRILLDVDTLDDYNHLLGIYQT